VEISERFIFSRRCAYESFVVVYLYGPAGGGFQYNFVGRKERKTFGPRSGGKVKGAAINYTAKGTAGDLG